MTANRQDLEVLIPNEFSTTVLTAVQRTSVVENVARQEVMTSDTKEIPRFGGFTVGTVAKGAEYAYSTNTPDVISLVARKIGGLAKIAEEDLVDTVTGEGTMRRYEAEAGDALGVFHDHAALGVTAAENGTTIPYTSLYRTLSQAQTTPWGNYGAGDNITQVEIGDFTGTGAQDAIIDWLQKYETSRFFRPGSTRVLADPSFVGYMRKVRDTTGNPIFTGTQEGGDLRFWGYTASYTQGARTGAVASQTPAGNPFMVIGDWNLAINGRARTSAGMPPGNPGTQWQRASNGVGFTSDEAIMKATMRRAFEIAVPQAFAILELIPTAP